MSREKRFLAEWKNFLVGWEIEKAVEFVGEGSTSRDELGGLGHGGGHGERKEQVRTKNSDSCVKTP